MIPEIDRHLDESLRMRKVFDREDRPDADIDPFEVFDRNLWLDWRGNQGPSPTAGDKDRLCSARAAATAPVEILRKRPNYQCDRV